MTGRAAPQEVEETVELGGGMPYHLRSDVVEQNQAIGRFTTAFSEMVATMKQWLHNFLTPADEEFPWPSNPLLHALTGPMTADPIRSAFFGMCAILGEFDESDRKVIRALQALVQREIELRNQVAHADWTLGWTDHQTGNPVEPTAHKVRITKSGVANEVVDLNASLLQREALRMDHITSTLHVVGNVCRNRQRGVGGAALQARLFTRKEGDGVEMVFMIEASPGGGLG
jgi:hypothetical protein